MIRAYRTDAIRHAEESLLAEGQPLMRQAAAALAFEVISALGHISGTRILGLIGAGNNGGDALFALAKLRGKGAACTALLAIPDKAHTEGLAAARRAGVRILELPVAEKPQNDADVTGVVTGVRHPTQTQAQESALEGVAEVVAREVARADAVIDGLVGIGARGALREPYATIVTTANEARAAAPFEPVAVAVDAPSGIGIDDGTVPGPAFRADITVTMGAPKVGLILDPARGYAGEVRTVDLGFVMEGEPALAVLTDADVADLWRVPGAHSHKYTRGVVGMMTGSRTYPGAGILSVAGAVGAGAGMIRFAGPKDLAQMMVMAHPEVVAAPGRVQAWVLGSGVDMDDSEAAAEVARRLHESMAESRPVVLDAGAISLAAHTELRSSVVLTPHGGEIAHLLTALGEATSREDVAANPARAARLASTMTGATVLLKGPIDIACAPDGPLYVSVGAPGWRATAGAGDVMAGIVGAMLAMWGDELSDLGDGHGIPARLAAAGAHVHARAAQMASGAHADAAGATHAGRPIRASDIADAVPEAIASILAS